tara:strand:- start:1284 stop:1871 length:588 start_codon:yes stop_codon:yes gene_type:complete
MTNSYITQLEKKQMKPEYTNVEVGDIVVVHKMIVEGKKQRVQRFKGTVIKIKGSLSRTSFTVRKVIDGIGVEKTFLLHSPLVPKIEVEKRSKVRRAKLYYLRDRIGSKANRLKVKVDSQIEEDPKNKATDKKATQAAEVKENKVEENNAKSTSKKEAVAEKKEKAPAETKTAQNKAEKKSATDDVTDTSTKTSDS